MRFVPRASNNAYMDLYEEIVALRRQGRRGAIATITNVRGSIPSFRTAKMEWDLAWFDKYLKK